MSGANTTSLNDLFKRVYGRGSKTFQQNLAAYFIGELATAPDKPGGQGFFHTTWIRGNEQGGAQNEDEALKDPQSPEPIQPIIAAKTNTWQFQFTGKAKAVSENDKFAFASAMDATMMDAQKRIMSDQNRQAFGNGIGTLTQVNGAVVGATQFTVDDVQYLRVNQRIDVFQSFGGAQDADNVLITGINIATNQVTVTPAVTLTDNALVVKAGVFDAAPADGKELTGVQRIVDDTTEGNTLQNINKVTFPEYQSNRIDAGNVPLSQDLLQRLMNRIMIVGGESPTKILSRHGVYRSFVNTALAQTRHQDDVVKAGHVKLTWNGLEWMLDKDCQIGTVYMLNMMPAYLAKYVVKDVDLADEDGKVINKLPGFDKYYGYYVGYLNIGTKKPNVHGKLINLTEPTF